MPAELNINLMGPLRVFKCGVEIPLPASRKTRALLGYLIVTARPHRRERLCELLWDLPDDPRAALRWALSKLREITDEPEAVRIVADRERVELIGASITTDLGLLQQRLHASDRDLSVAGLTSIANELTPVFLEGLDKAGSADFAKWLAMERNEIAILRACVFDRLKKHADTVSAERAKWAKKSQSLMQQANDTQVQYRYPPPSNSDALQASPSAMWNSFKARTLRAQKIGFCQANDGTKIAHAIVGSGPPLLKAANWLGHLEYDWTSPIWGKSFAEIAKQRTFIRYDERGCGLSDWDIKDLSFGAFVDDLDAVVQNLGLKRFPLLGISQGCAVSIEYAVRFPERVSALILFGGYAAGWRHLASPEEQKRREAVIELTKVGWGTATPAYRHIFSQTFMPDAHRDDLVWFDEFQRLTTSPDNAAKFQQAFGDIDVRARLAQVRVPTLVLHSRHDHRIPLEQGREIADAIPNAKFVVLESNNHILMDYEPAWPVAARAIARFLLENGA